MRRRRSKEPSGCLTVPIIIFGVVWFLIDTAPVLFYTVIVPLVVLAVIGFIRWVKK